MTTPTTFYVGDLVTIGGGKVRYRVQAILRPAPTGRMARVMSLNDYRSKSVDVARLRLVQRGELGRAADEADHPRP